jgi:hypothetical protein
VAAASRGGGRGDPTARWISHSRRGDGRAAPAGFPGPGSRPGGTLVRGPCVAPHRSRARGHSNSGVCERLVLSPETPRNQTSPVGVRDARVGRSSTSITPLVEVHAVLRTSAELARFTVVSSRSSRRDLGRCGVPTIERVVLLEDGSVAPTTVGATRRPNHRRDAPMLVVGIGATRRTPLQIDRFHRRRPLNVRRTAVQQDGRVPSTGGGSRTSMH